MIRKVGFIVIGLIISNYSIADNRYVMGVVREKDNPALPVVGANIYWAGTSKGTTSDSMGAFRLALENALPDARLVVSFVGFRTDTLFAVPGNELQVLLERNTELDEVLIRERRKGVYLSTLDPVQSHKVTATELQKAACCNLSESFETNASVDIAFTDAVTGAQQIRMLGLSGTYVQTLSENMPMLRGLAAPYGLGWVPGPWMESIQISKGTSSVVNGYEALTGQINVEFKKPGGTEVLHFNAYGNDALKTEANLNYSHSFSDSLMTTVFLHGENQWKAIDLNGDRFMDLPNVRQINFMNRWNFIPKRGGHREIGIKALNELRRSGQVGAFGDPGAGLYGIEIETRRYEIFAKNGILFDRPGTSLGLQFSGSFHDQQSVYGLKQYTGTQYSVYFNAIYQGHFGSDLHTYKTGISFLGDWLDERLDDRPFRNQELVPGGFFEYSYNLIHRLNLLAGSRIDYSTRYGLFFTPRVHVRWSPQDWITIRASAGKGFRKPLPLAENHYLLASSRTLVLEPDLRQEEAVNTGASIQITLPLGERELTLVADYYYTRFLHQVVREMDRDVQRVYFSNLDGLSYSGAFQTELLYEPFRGLTLNAAWRWMDVKQTQNGIVRALPLTSRYKGMVSLSYKTRLNKWQFDLTTQFNGGGRMPDPDPTDPLWKEEYPPFTEVYAQITKRIKRWEFYVGVENLFDFTMDQPIIAAHDPWGKNFDGSMVWGPVHGRKIYVGLRYTLHHWE